MKLDTFTTSFASQAKLASAIKTSPDLTRPDATAALAAYRAQIDEEVALGSGASAPQREEERYRSGRAHEEASRLREAVMVKASDRRAGAAVEFQPKTITAREENAAKRLAEIAADIRKDFAKDPLPDLDVFAAELLEEHNRGADLSNAQVALSSWQRRCAHGCPDRETTPHRLPSR